MIDHRLSQLDAAAGKLSFSEQLWLMERVAQRIRERSLHSVHMNSILTQLPAQFRDLRPQRDSGFHLRRNRAPTHRTTLGAYRRNRFQHAQPLRLWRLWRRPHRRKRFQHAQPLRLWRLWCRTQVGGRSRCSHQRGSSVRIEGFFRPFAFRGVCRSHA